MGDVCKPCVLARDVSGIIYAAVLPDIGAGPACELMRMMSEALSTICRSATVTCAVLRIGPANAHNVSIAGTLCLNCERDLAAIVERAASELYTIATGG